MWTLLVAGAGLCLAGGNAVAVGNWVTAVGLIVAGAMLNYIALQSLTGTGG